MNIVMKMESPRKDEISVRYVNLVVSEDGLCVLHGASQCIQLKDKDEGNTVFRNFRKYVH